VGEQNEDQDDVVRPAWPPLTTVRGREMTAGLREAMDDARRSVAVLAARVPNAHTARVWLPLGHISWESYCDAEFGSSRAQAYRLLDVARSLTAILGAVAAGTETSRTRYSAPAAAAALDYGLSQRALVQRLQPQRRRRGAAPPPRRARPQRSPGPRRGHSARGGSQLTDEFAVFAGLLGIEFLLCKPRDPEAKGLVVRANGYRPAVFV
jgi:hypothetical protein